MKMTNNIFSEKSSHFEIKNFKNWSILHDIQYFEIFKRTIAKNR